MLYLQAFYTFWKNDSLLFGVKAKILTLLQQSETTSSRPLLTKCDLLYYVRIWG